jgi:hypothetical protein
VNSLTSPEGVIFLTRYPPWRTGLAPMKRTTTRRRAGENHGVSRTTLAAIGGAAIVAVGSVVVALIQTRDTNPEDLQLFGVECSHERARPGDTVTLSFPMKVIGDDGRRVGLGAGLFGDDEPIYDQAKDQMITVVPGEYVGDRAPTRQFDLPTDLAPGRYRLSGQIWRGQPGQDDDGSLEDDACDLVVE